MLPVRVAAGNHDLEQFVFRRGAVEEDLGERQSGRIIIVLGIAIRFLDFVKEVRNKEGDELFPEVPKATDGKEITIFSKRFSWFLKKAGMKPDGSGNCFHMFRHTLRDAIRNCGIPEEIADAVQGWARYNDQGRN